MRISVSLVHLPSSEFESPPLRLLLADQIPLLPYLSMQQGLRLLCLTGLRRGILL